MTTVLVQVFIFSHTQIIILDTYESTTNWGLPISASKVKVDTSVANSQVDPQITFLCLEVDQDSNFIVTAKIDQIEQSNQIQGFKAQSGWTWFAITVSELFQYSTITLFASNDAYTGQVAATPFKSESFILDGIYGVVGTPDPSTSSNILSIGCQFDSYSNCNKPLSGYFFELKIWEDKALTSVQLAFEVKMTCTGSCSVCPSVDSKCFDQRSLTILDLDLEIDAQTVTDTSGNSYDFLQGNTVTVGASDGDPIRIPFQGMRFSSTSFLLKQTPTIPIPNGITVETWFRFDFNNSVTQGDLQYIYQAIRQDSNKLEIAVDYTLLKIRLNNQEVNLFVNWTLSTNWRYLAVTLVKTYQDSHSYTKPVGISQVKVYLDNTLLATTSGQTFKEQLENSEQKLALFAINQLLLLFQHVIFINFTNLACIANGKTTSCNICDKTTNQCFSSCGFNTLDNLCTPCDWKCSYCFGTAATCSACDTTKNLIGTAPTCSCAAGFVQISNQCQACNKNCALCLDTTNSNCPVCSTNAYLFAGKQCLEECPYGYMKDSSYHQCHFDTNKLIEPVYQLDYLNKGCDPTQYSAGSICSSCHSSCYTCAGGSSTDCTSCVLGKYLYDSTCSTCDATGMIIGSSGQCVEICGDGKNFGLFDCDDGNNSDGDGCSGSCEIETDWTCSGGSKTTADTCKLSQINIESLQSTENNNIILILSKPAFIIDDLTEEDIEIQIQKYDGTYVSNFEALFQKIQEMPTQKIFVQLKINEFLQGKEKSSKVRMIYKKSGKIFDTRLNELSTYSDAFTYIGKNFPEMDQTEKDAIKSMGIINNLAIIIIIGMTSFLSVKYNSSNQPAFLIFFGMQEMLYTLLYSFDYPLDMKFYWKYFTWLQLEFPNMIQNNLNADSFIVNNNLKILIWFTYTLLFLIFSCIKRKISHKKSEQVMNQFLFSSTISFFMCCLMPFGQASFIEIQNIKKTLPFKLASVSSAFFVLATIFFFLYSITLISVKAGSHYHNERFLKKYLSILKPFKAKQICLLYYPLYCWKRFIQIIITALFIDDPVLQALAVALLQAMFLIYVFSARPFQSTYNNVLSLISQLFPFLISIYSISFDGSTNDPEKAFNFGWGAILMVSVYCLSYFAFAIIANVYHVLDRAEFAQRYTQEIEDKIRMTILSIFYRKGAAVDKMKQTKQNFVQEEQISILKKRSEPIKEQAPPPIVDSFTPSQQPIVIKNNQFTMPLGINDDKKTNIPVFQSSNKMNQKNNNAILPPIDGHKTQLDPKALVTPDNANAKEGFFKNKDAKMKKDEDEEDDDEDADHSKFGIDMSSAVQEMNNSKRKTKKVKKKVKTKKKKNLLGETVGPEASKDQKNEYHLI
ncbi:UNKNOWN [Stylonychia lemnae]|uniref:Uncharacterized protein n=1 Tax=Stylonychia lemnae TaxID=5949 RepID=A0A078B5Y4_STYLE|nr:UNKNOWN [Stylonychia lemnae]|eukprot:CDW88903.1 UNKNOWN [Stylonychia lemnae]